MSRSERFRERIKFERDVLKTVNLKINEGSLRGLSRVAIESWRDSISNTSKNESLDEIVQSLLRMSEKMRANATASRDSFEVEEAAEALAIEQNSLLLLLEEYHVDS